MIVQIVVCLFACLRLTSGGCLFAGLDHCRFLVVVGLCVVVCSFGCLVVWSFVWLAVNCCVSVGLAICLRVCFVGCVIIAVSLCVG